MTENIEKVVMVTGASGNVGRGVVRAFDEAGWRIALVDRNAERVADCVRDLGLDSDRYKGFPADLSDPTAVDHLLDHVTDHLGQIDALVHTVGGFAMGDPVHAGNLDVFDQMMALNARMLYLLGGRVAQHMIDNVVQGSLTFVLAKSAAKGLKNQAAYTASKAAAARIMEAMAAELVEHGIRVNGISPSLVDTPPNRESMPNADFSKWVSPDQIGHLAQFLASDMARDISGENVVINGRM